MHILHILLHPPIIIITEILDRALVLGQLAKVSSDCNRATPQPWQLKTIPCVSWILSSQYHLHRQTSPAYPFRISNMSKAESFDVSEAPEAHSTASQHHLFKNDDPALDKSYEHTHGHMHHDKHAEQGRNDEVVYSKGTTLERSTIPHQASHNHDIARGRNANPSNGDTGMIDTEKATMSPGSLHEADPRTHTLSNFYLKYRLVFHLFVWLFFTGYVAQIL